MEKKLLGFNRETALNLGLNFADVFVLRTIVDSIIKNESIIVDIKNVEFYNQYLSNLINYIPEFYSALQKIIEKRVQVLENTKIITKDSKSRYSLGEKFNELLTK